MMYGSAFVKTARMQRDIARPSSDHTRKTQYDAAYA